MNIRILSMRAVLSAALLYLIAAACSTDSSALEGRWNITETFGEGTAVSWLEVTRTGDGWRGRFLHRGGHALKAEIKVDGEQLQATMIPESAANRGDRKPPSITGHLEGERLVGTGTDWRGNTFSWIGVRAPDRLEGSDRSVSWGAPISLFNGTDLTGWQSIGDRPNNWKAIDGELVNEKTGANIRTVDEFRDFKLHIEFKIPPGSNSGIYLRGRYETQVADDYGKEPYARGVGGIYGFLKPTVNAAKPAGEWNSVDATIIGYRVTIVVNGQTTLDGQLIDGITGGALDANESDPGPIMLQGDHGPVYYRNIVLTPAQ